MDTLIATDVTLLALDENTGRFPKRCPMEGVVGAGLLMELATMERLEAVESDARILVLDGSPTGSHRLDEVLADIAEVEGATPKDVLAHISGNLLAGTLDDLAAADIVRSETTRRRFRLSTSIVWRLVNTTRRDELLGQLREVLLHGQEPDDRVATMVATLHMVKLLNIVVHCDDKDRLGARAEEIIDSSWFTHGVAGAIARRSDTVYWASVADGGLIPPI